MGDEVGCLLRRQRQVQGAVVGGVQVGELAGLGQEEGGRWAGGAGRVRARAPGTEMNDGAP